MKKVIILLFGLLIISACGPKLDAEYEVTYRIHYPDTTIQEQRHVAGTEEETSFRVQSSRGTDYLVEIVKRKGMYTIRSSAAPIELVSSRLVEQ